MSKGGRAPRLGRPFGSVAWQTLARNRRTHACRWDGGGLTVRTPPRRAWKPSARVVRVTRLRAWPDPAVLAGLDLRRLADRPAHDHEQPEDRDLQQHHQPDEGPGGHLTRWYTRPPIRQNPGERARPPAPRGRAKSQPLSWRGAPLNWVIACSSLIRVAISLPARRSMRSV